MKFRKKPVVIDAMQVPGPTDMENWGKLSVFMGLNDQNIKWSVVRVDGDLGVSITTLEGTMRGDIGDWIIRGVKGEFYPCKPDIFTATYDAVSE